MPEDTLLTDNEIVAIWDGGKDLVRNSREVAKAQARKTKRGMVEWLEEPCDKPMHKTPYHKYNLRKNCPDCWQDLKESLECEFVRKIQTPCQNCVHIHWRNSNPAGFCKFKGIKLYKEVASCSDFKKRESLKYTHGGMYETPNNERCLK